MTGFVACRICGEPQISEFLSLGRTPLANSLLTSSQLNEPEPDFPLDVGICPACSSVQLMETVSPQQLFTEYLYQSSFSDTMLAHAAELVAEIRRREKFAGDGLVVEIASNDGYLLRNFAAAGIPVLGIDPAANVAVVAEARGVPTITRFFSSALARELRADSQGADAIIALNVLAHVPDPNDVAEGLGILLKASGVVVIETPYVRDLVDRLEFDTIYHEHVFYHSLTALVHLFRRQELEVVSASRIPIHGGSLRLWIAPAGSRAADGSVAELLAEEAEWGIADVRKYRRFAERVHSLCAQLNGLLGRLKSEGATIAAYGASAKGSTLLNVCGIGRDTLEYVVDRSTVKQGRHTPGRHLAIYPPERLLETMPDYVLLLAWNFANEILTQQSEYCKRGGRFIVPLPEPGVLQTSALLAEAAPC